MTLQIFDSYAEAAEALEPLNQAYKQLLVAQGHLLDEQGNIVPLNALSGLPDYAAARTACWDVVRAREDGKFEFYGMPAA